jgi:zinc transport system substrate-binding protein
MKKFFNTLLTGVLACCMLSSCAVAKTQIAYTVYPIGYLVSRIAGDTVKAVSIQDSTIVQRANIAEDYEDTLKNSAVFLHIGKLEPYLTIYSGQIEKDISSQLDLSSLNAVYDFKRYTVVMVDGAQTYVEAPYYKGTQFDTIDTDEKDLFLWNDPISMLSMAKNIRDWLETTFPDQKQTYEANFTKLETDLVDLDAQYQALATSNQNNSKVIKFVTMTASFGNWQKTYGFQVYPVILSKYGALPNAEQLQIIKDRIKADGVKYIVYEPNMTDDMIALFDELKDELGLTRVELSNLSSLTDQQESDGKDYLSIMYENLSVLQTMVQDAGEENTGTAGDTTEAEATASPEASAEATPMATESAAARAVSPDQNKATASPEATK